MYKISSGDIRVQPKSRSSHPCSHLPHLSCERSKIGPPMLLRWWKTSGVCFFNFPFQSPGISFQSRGKQIISVKGQIANILGFQVKRKCPQLLQQLWSQLNILYLKMQKNTFGLWAIQKASSGRSWRTPVLESLMIWSTNPRDTF